MNRRWLSFTLIACATAWGCKEKMPEPTADEAVLPAVPPPMQSAPPPLDTAKLAIPTEEDFEAEAELAISSKNLNEELDKLEREIGTL